MEKKHGEDEDGLRVESIGPLLGVVGIRHSHWNHCHHCWVNKLLYGLVTPTGDPIPAIPIHLSIFIIDNTLTVGLYCQHHNRWQIFNHPIPRPSSHHQYHHIVPQSTSVQAKQGWLGGRYDGVGWHRHQRGQPRLLPSDHMCTMIMIVTIITMIINNVIITFTPSPRFAKLPPGSRTKEMRDRFDNYLSSQLATLGEIFCFDNFHRFV